MSPHVSLERLLFAAIALAMLTQSALSQDETISTREDRAALVDYLIQKTIEREAFSEIKNRRLGIDPIEEMRKYREEVINAKDEVEKANRTLIALSRGVRNMGLSSCTGCKPRPRPRHVNSAN